MVTKSITKMLMMGIVLSLTVGTYCSDMKAQSFGTKFKSALREQLGTDSSEPSQKKKGKKEKKKEKMSMQLAEDDIKLTVYGEGTNKEEATKNALRSAIEQSFGTFVSSNTQQINDELLKDEIVTVSSGNIKGYEYIAENVLPNGRFQVCLKTVVTIGNLIKYCSNKGMSTDLAGATFAMNVKMKKLNKENEEVALSNMLQMLHSLRLKMFDYEIKVNEPKRINDNGDYWGSYRFSNQNNSYYSCDADILVKANQNTVSFFDVFHNTLSSLTLTNAEQDEYKKTNSHFSPLYVRNYSPETYLPREQPTYCLRSGTSTLCNWLERILLEGILNFQIKDNLGSYKLEEKLINANDLYNEVYNNGKVSIITYDEKVMYNSTIYFKSENRLFWGHPHNSNDGYSYRNIIGNHQEWIDRVENTHAIRVPYLIQCPQKNETLYKVKMKLIYSLDELNKISEVSIEPAS